MLFLACLCAMASASGKYSTSMAEVGKVAVRAVFLHAIEAAVAVWDPIKTVKAPTAPAGSAALPLSPGKESQEPLLRHIRRSFPGCEIAVRHLDNRPILRSSYDFAYQPAVEALNRLRERYRIDQLLPPGENDFFQMVALVNWVHDRWKHGSSGADAFDPAMFDADAVLTKATSGARFWCHVYAMTFVQLAASVGFQARLVSLTTDGYDLADSHAVAEVWSNTYRKWIMVDPDFNIWYSRNGLPQSVLEIHNASIGKEAHLLAVEKGISRSAPEYELRIPNLLKYYRYFAVDLRNDWLTNRYFPGHPASSDHATLFWEDQRLSPVLNLKKKVNVEKDLYWELNTAQITVQPSEKKGALQLRIDTVTPNFACFAVELDKRARHLLRSSEWTWPLHKGQNELEVCSVNLHGRKGIPSKVVIDITERR